ncbi:MAG: hypothetical protein EBT07_07340 [Actinobacteria bacterium]|jgi:hypothetical protein|nr:hypothetical protein [Actinomycetota bacterium]
MKTEFVLIVVLLLAVFALAIFRRKPELPVENFLSFRKPTLWWFVDTEINARSDTSQNTEQPNRGYLQVALQALKRTQSADFAIATLIGRDAVLNHLPEAPAYAKQLPPALWRHWVIANMLEKYGGLVMDGNSTLCVGPSLLPHVEAQKAAMFGTYSDEPVVNPETASAPGPAPYAGWASSPNHPAWTYAASVWNALVARGPQAWSSAIARRTDMSVWATQKQYGAVVLRVVDGGRLPNGKARQLEDLFGRVGNPADPRTSLVNGTVYVSYDGDELSRRHEFNWFLRLSPSQIHESDLVWARLAGY